MQDQKDSELKRTNYELFILVLAILSLLNMLLILILREPDVVQVIFYVDLLLSVIFIGDFLFRLYSAESRREYFVKQYGFLDLIGSLPVAGLRIFRTVRIVRTIRLLRPIGLRKIVRQAIEHRADTALLTVVTLVILLLEFGSIAILQTEGSSAEANIQTANDALWWVIVTVSTVGYGDHYATTNIGRFVSVFVIIAGVGLFGTISGFLANLFLGESGDAANESKDITLEILMAELQQIQEAQRQDRQVQDGANTELMDRLAVVEKLLQGDGPE